MFALELLQKWAPIDVDDALELLSKDFMGVAEIRKYAVSRLEEASEDELQERARPAPSGEVFSPRRPTRAGEI